MTLRVLAFLRQRWLLILGTAVLLSAVAVFGLRHLGADSVAMVMAQRGEVLSQVSGPGTVQARVPLTLSARITSTVTAVTVDVGDGVRAGQVLVVLEARDLAARQAAAVRQQQSLASQVQAAAAGVLKARADLELARIRESRDADLHAQGFLSPAAIDASVAAARAADALLRNSEATLDARRADQAAAAEELVIARTQVSFTRLVSPMSGIVIQRLIEPGTTVAPGTPVLRLVDPATLWIAMRVDEALIEKVVIGQPATIRLRSGTVVPGRVARFNLQSDAATRELEVNIAFTTLPARVALDQEAQVHIEVAREHGLVLPATAVGFDPAGRASVLRVSSGRTHLTPVQVGLAHDGMVVVRGGLVEGALVVADARSAKPGVRVQAAAPTPARGGASWNSH